MTCCSPNLASSNWRMRVVAEVTCVSCLNQRVRIGCMVCGLAPCWAISLVPENSGILDRAPVFLSSIGIRMTAYMVVASFGPLRWCLRCGTKHVTARWDYRVGSAVPPQSTVYWQQKARNLLQRAGARRVWETTVSRSVCCRLAYARRYAV